MRVPAMLRSRDRAVTEEDFEFLAMQALPAAIGRVKCLQPRPASAGRVAPGQVYLLVIPRVERPEGYLEPDQLELNPTDIAALTAYLDERRLLTTRLDIRPPATVLRVRSIRITRSSSSSASNFSRSDTVANTIQPPLQDSLPHGRLGYSIITARGCQPLATP